MPQRNTVFTSVLHLRREVSGYLKQKGLRHDAFRDSGPTHDWIGEGFYFDARYAVFHASKPGIGVERADLFAGRFASQKAGLTWEQENPNYLRFSPLGEPWLITRGGTGVGTVAKRATKIPAGHPEGYFEAFAQLYTDLSEQIIARIEERTPDPRSMLVPGVDDGVHGVQFILAALDSGRPGRRCRGPQESPPPDPETEPL